MYRVFLRHSLCLCLALDYPKSCILMEFFWWRDGLRLDENMTARTSLLLIGVALIALSPAAVCDLLNNSKLHRDLSFCLWSATLSATSFVSIYIFLFVGFYVYLYLSPCRSVGLHQFLLLCLQFKYMPVLLGLFFKCLDKFVRPIFRLQISI